MKIKGEFIMRELVGEILLVPVGQTALQFNGMITLNPAPKFGAAWSRALLTRRFFGVSWTSSTWRRIPHARIWTGFWKKCGGGICWRNDTPAPRNRIVHNLYKFDGPYSAEFGATCACCQMEFPV